MFFSKRRRTYGTLHAEFGLAYTLLLLISVSRCGAQHLCDTKRLLDAAQSLVKSNYNQELGWTVPSTSCAPYLSSTDSLFAAYAYSHFAPDIGMKELEANLEGQWESGLIPRMRFPPGSDNSVWLQGTYYPGPSVWKTPPSTAFSSSTSSSSTAAGKRNSENHNISTTAGLASPPWHAIMAMQLFNQRRDDEAFNFLVKVFPPIYKYHSYLHGARNAGNGLVYSYHPWESDLPADSPVWAFVLKDTQDHLTAEGWHSSLDYTEPAAVPGFPGLELFNAEMYLTELLGSRLGYDDKVIQESSPYLVIDVEFNSILAASDAALAAMAKVLQLHSSSVVDASAHGAIASWAAASISRFESLWAGDRYSSYALSPRTSPNTAVRTSPSERKEHKARKQAAPSPLGGVSEDAPSPLPPGSFFPVPIVSNFWPLYVPVETTSDESARGGESSIPSSRVQGLVFQMITTGISNSFDCQGDMYRLPTSACSAHDPSPDISLLHNFVVQRGLENNGDVGINGWLLNETVNLVCDASMDPFVDGKATTLSTGPFRFARYFDPITGDAQVDMFGMTSTLAASLACVLLNKDALNGRGVPPISHDVTFALVVIELVIAFATGLGFFLLSLHLLRKMKINEAESGSIWNSRHGDGMPSKTEVTAHSPHFREDEGDVLYNDRQEGHEEGNTRYFKNPEHGIDSLSGDTTTPLYQTFAGATISSSSLRGRRSINQSGPSNTSLGSVGGERGDEKNMISRALSFLKFW